MGLTFPCEIISWHVLPAVRREIASYLINEKQVTRKTVAKKLGLTEAAVCQYLKHKRGGSHKFSDNDQRKIREMADMLLNSDKGFEGMCVVCKEFDASGQMLAEAGVKRI
ncbi:MAG: transcriptional regulator [Candidatus Diapherotrites archaeon]|uniref:Transcriptional regulator n=1 Tax=Candidatus Iainarchaeum sp. TaxID=3101447 RepID=A0A8T3YNM4_9ARCH|nr:transcriptional regulator [Candidatus Diapherotrites archaeon]